MKITSLFILGISVTLFSCISTRNTIKNIDNTIAGPTINETFNSFIIEKKATDKKYAYNENYPVNVGFTTLEDGLNNQLRYLNALAGPNGEKISYKLVDTCCPFPTKRSDMGAGMLDIFEITYEGQKKTILLYINKYERGELMIPVGLSAKK